jgi:hypothetical protein
LIILITLGEKYKLWSSNLPSLHLFSVQNSPQHSVNRLSWRLIISLYMANLLKIRTVKWQANRATYEYIKRATKIFCDSVDEPRISMFCDSKIDFEKRYL